ncbi:MAG: polyribonucleotide nucleotidyltransferase [Patescibacteria group bacterium]
MEKREYSLKIGEETLTAVFSDLTNRTNGSVTIKYGNTIVLVTAVMSDKQSSAPYFPLVVDYEEKFYAAGLILGGRFIKREGRPSEEAILAARVIDRTIRPLFDHYIRRDIQIVATVLSIDEKNDPDIPAVIGASLALGVSDIPWRGPVGAVRLGLPTTEDKNFVINPDYNQSGQMALELLVCGKDHKVNMIEAEGKEIKEEIIEQALAETEEIITEIENWQKEIITKEGKTKQEIPAPVLPQDLVDSFEEKIKPELTKAIFSGPGDYNIKTVNKKWQEIVEAGDPDNDVRLAADNHFEDAVDKLLREAATENNRRADGRQLDEVRSLYAEVDNLSPIVHGSGIFYRGGTHILSVLTLSGPDDSQIIDGMETQGKKYFMHHYNFPPFSVGETGRLGGINRRSIGHGALAEKSLRGVLPDRETFPYTIRLVSEALASNGSTSMGSLCASSLALMDGGVPISGPVAGIAMGLMINPNTNKQAILTDIQGPEDSHGDMDFKIAGTTEGVTGLQLDIKLDGIPRAILSQALNDGRQARLKILEVITAALPKPRPQVKESAPGITILTIPISKIGTVIGPGGKMIQSIIEKTGAEIKIEDDGKVFLTGSQTGIAEAEKVIKELTREYKAGEEFTGEVVGIKDFGAFVRIGKETEGLVHISEIAPFRIDKTEDVLIIGQKVPVKILAVDNQGKIKLSIKAVNPDFIKPHSQK